MRKLGIIIASVFLCMAYVMPSFASETKQVAIELDAETDGTDAYLPGAQADYRLTLKNKLGDSWVRVKFRFSKKLVSEDFSDSNLHILSNWEKHGDYYYYTKKANARTDIPVVDGLKIPDMDIGPEGMSVTVTVDADAVQYDAFNPDFTKADPWAGAEISHSASSSGSRSSGSVSTDIVKIYSSPQEYGVGSTGNWELISAEKHLWKYSDRHGNYVKDGWVYVYNPYSPTKNKYDWFHFNEDGYMTFGWYKATDSIWYYTHGTSDGNLGMLIKGWHNDPDDNKTYYLDAKNGIMLSGWQEIDGKNYYFSTLSDIPKQTWFWETGIGKWVYRMMGYRSYGSMYVSQ